MSSKIQQGLFAIAASLGVAAPIAHADAPITTTPIVFASNLAERLAPPAYVSTGDDTNLKPIPYHQTFGRVFPRTTFLEFYDNINPFPDVQVSGDPVAVFAKICG